MTSSLVGSEMCIRDRPVKLYHTARWVPALASKKPPPKILATEEQQAVSYTHLTLPTICSV
eukprot:480097-Prorocentrum_lima.AAC.1